MSDGDACGSGCGYCGRCTGGPAPEICADCGGGCFPGRFDVAPFLCDDCYDQRTRWADDQEQLQIERRTTREAAASAMKMARANLSLPPIPKKDVA